MTCSGLTAYPGPHGKPECARCKREGSPSRRLKRCAGCSLTMYCSKECQRGDWQTHVLTPFVPRQASTVLVAMQASMPTDYSTCSCPYRLVCRNTGASYENNFIDPGRLAATGYSAVTTLNAAPFLIGRKVNRTL
ncbi:hypothetical protein BD414DRAFT_454405 [Trametes punicea]|nr:hypothetical protein BD414DRAFT_454405 [Trametes punicea]